MKTLLGLCLLLCLVASQSAHADVSLDCFNRTLPSKAEVMQAMAEAGVTKAPLIYTTCDLQSRNSVPWYYDAINPIALRQGYPGSILLDDKWRDTDGLREAFRRMAAQNAASPKVKALMPRVEAKLLELRWKVQGYSNLPAPALRVADLGHRSPMARIDGMMITLNSHATRGCEDVLIAHELTHDALGRVLGLSGRSRQSEEAATEVAWSIAENPYRPNCVTGNQIGGHVGDYESKFDVYPREYFGPRR